MNSGGEEKKIGEDLNFPLLNSNSFKLIEKKIKKMNKMISKKLQNLFCTGRSRNKKKFT